MSEEAKKSIAGPLTVRPNTDDRKPSPLPAVPLKKVIIKSADMIPDMQKEAVDIAVAAFEKYNVEKDVAEQVKKEFDKRHGPTWHCIVGRNFDACFVYEIMFDKMAGSGQPRQQVENETHAIETTDTSARKTEY